MKFTTASGWIHPTLLAVASCAFAAEATLTTTSPVFQPYHVFFQQLANLEDFEPIRQDFLQALTEVGMLTIRGIPGLNKQDVLQALQPCIKMSSATQEQILRDGTRRRTLAAHTSPGEQMGSGIMTPIIPGLSHGSNDHHEDALHCQHFAKATDAFRKAADVATKAFAARLASVLPAVTVTTEAGNRPLLVSRGGETFDNLLDVVQHGNHLEHFHSYQVPTASSSSSSMRTKKGTDETIEWHVDQGLFIVFTPATLVREDPSSPQRSAIQGLTNGFYIQLGDGTKAEVEFSSEDDLVILLGDGFNQYINPHYYNNDHLDAAALRAVPHALSMSPHRSDEARVWYGRMVLPPAQAIHPVHDETFGRLRELVVDKDTVEDEAVVMACSTLANARHLQTTTCEEGTLYCWHRCMSLEEHGVSEEICAAQGLDLWCINPRNQLWDNSHGDFFPACIDVANAENATAFPNLPNYPRDEETACTTESFERFLQQEQESTYEHSMNLDDVAVFQWTVQENNVVAGRLAYNGLFGFLALGYPSTDGPKRGMHGAEIIMAVPGGNYDAAEGFDLTIPPSINEYVIHPDGSKSSFRFWATPVSTADGTISTSSATTTGNIMEGSYGLEFNDCFTAITFETTGFHGKPFNLTGVDHFIWAANGVDYFAGYHTHRGHIYVSWLDGNEEDDHSDEGDHSGHSHDHDHDKEDSKTEPPTVSTGQSTTTTTSSGSTKFYFMFGWFAAFLGSMVIP